MYLSKIRVIDYKSFRDSGDIEFKPGINLIVGQNNSGKTTLLEALEIKIQDVPHRSLKTLKNKIYENNDRDNSTLYVSLKLLGKDFPKLEQINDNLGIWIPLPEKLIKQIYPPKDVPNHLLSGKVIKEKEEAQRKFINDFVSKFNENSTVGITINFKYSDLNPNDNYNFGILDENFDTRMQRSALRWAESKSEFSLIHGPNTNRDVEDFGWSKIKEFRNYTYRFNAERSNLGGCLVGYNKELLSDASNLAEVLQNIKNDNDDVYEEFNKYVSEVIPSVKWVTSVKVKNNKLSVGNWNEVRVWSVDKKSRRTDLAFPLSDCGTGIGQVLAILYVVVASEEPRTIIIDEPNSFLHPGAAKKLIQILNKFPQHQYFISTHSPEILSAAKPSTITRLKYVDGETIAESVNLEQTNDLRETLDEIGVRFSDVFFSENILWVEGETEEKAFPLILESGDELFDVAILPLVHTDDLRERKAKGRKHAKLVFEIYERLSGANALTPPFVAVILDKENSTSQELDDLTKQFGEDKLKFLPKMMYENYLIDAEAITNALNAEIIEDADKITLEQVEKWIEAKRTDKFLSDKNNSEEVLEQNDWLEKVHAANLLECLFSELSNKTVEYRKTTHSVKLTQWLLENKPEQLSELKSFLINLIANK
jgi:predicted ATPase